MSPQIEQTPLLGNDMAISSETPTRASAQGRLFFIDNLRVVLTVLVVLHHLAITYGAIGSWYYHDPASTMFTSIILTIIVVIDQAFFMGLFFLISAYFTPGTYDRKGGRAFLWDRCLRLGIPLLVYDLVLAPLVLYIPLAHGLHESYWSFYGTFLLSLQMLGTGPSWFIEALLYFAVLYSAARWMVGKRIGPARASNELPSTWHIILFILVLAVITFLVRLWWPLNSYQALGFQLAEFAQYISLLFIGLIAYRRHWFLRFSVAQGRIWLAVAIGAILLLPVIIIATGAVGHASLFEGGLAWQAFVYALWEAVACVGLCIGLVVLFRERFNTQGKFSKAMVSGAYTVYLIHPLIIVPLAYVVRNIVLYPLLKFALVALIAVPLCFLVSYWIRKLPLARHIL